jgi:hypothetical protein
MTVFVRKQEYRIITSPDPLTDDDECSCMALPDPEQRVIWIDPAVSPSEMPDLLHEVAQHLDRLVPASE